MEFAKPRQKSRRPSGHPNNHIDYRPYIHRTLKNVNDKRRISKEAIDSLNDMTQHFSQRMVNELGLLINMKRSGNRTLTDADVLSAVRLILSSDLQKYTVNSINKAIAYHVISLNQREKKVDKK